MAEAQARGVEVFPAPYDLRRLTALGSLPDRTDAIVVQVSGDLEPVLDAIRHLDVPGRQILVVGASTDLIERKQLLAAGADRVLEGRPDPARTLRTALAWGRGEGAPLHVALLGGAPTLTGLAEELSRAGLPASIITRFEELTARGATDGAPALLVDQDSSPLEGIDLCRLLRARREWDPCPIVLMASHPDPQLIKRLLSAGADDVVSTTLPPDKIVNVLRRRGGECQSAVRPGERDTTAGLLLPDTFVSLASSRLERCHDLQVPFALLRVLPEDTGSSVTDDSSGKEILTVRTADALRSCFLAHDLFGRCAKGGLHAAAVGMSVQDMRPRLPVVRRALAERGIRASVTSTVSFEDDADLQDLLAVVHGERTDAVPEEEPGTPPPAPIGVRPGTTPPEDDPLAYRPVVLVDDDLVIRELLKRVLSSRGFSVVEFDNGVDAARALSALDAPERFRLVVLDVNLPGASGFGVLRAMRDAGTVGRLPVILLTARARSEDVLEGLELGAWDHLAKPFAVPLFLHKINTLLVQGTR
jgi:DNA-binding response OmpR family regulator